MYGQIFKKISLIVMPKKTSRYQEIKFLKMEVNENCAEVEIVLQKKTSITRNIIFMDYKV